MKKKLLIILIALLCVSTFLLGACANKEKQEALDNYIFAYDKSALSGEIVLPKLIGEHEATWSVDKPDTIHLEARDEDYLLTVTRPDARVDAKLTVSLSKKVSKTFDVFVLPVDVYEIIDNYTFAQKDAYVGRDFALDQSTTYAGKTATITWSINEAYADLATISADGTQCLVTPSGVASTVQIKATFDYGGKTSSKTYRFTAVEEVSHEEEVARWHNSTGSVMTISGYVLAVADKGEGYDNISFYMIDDDFCSTYYIYQIKYDDASHKAQIVPGVHVVVTGAKSTAYHGLIESTAGSGSYVVDSSRTINVTDHIRAFDNELISGAPATKQWSGGYISLTDWVVKSVEENLGDSSTTTLLTLTKGGVDVKVVISKYAQGFYSWKAGKTSVTDETATALASHYMTSFVAGDVVSITGLYSYYDGHNIIAIANDKIAKSTATVDSSKVDYPANKVGATIKAIQTAIEPLTTATVINPTTVTLPVSADGVTVTYGVFVEGEVSATGSQIVAISGSTLTVTPASARSTNVKVTVSVEGFSTSFIFSIFADSSATAEIPDPTVLTVAGATALAPTAAEGDKYVVAGTVKAIDEGGYSTQHNNISLTITEGTNDLYCYRLAGGSDLAVGDSIVVVGELGTYNSNAQFKAGATYTKLPTDPALVSIADALALCVDGNTTNAVVVGNIKAIDTAYSEQFKNISVVITDGTNDILMYRMKGTGAEDLKVGDAIIVTGLPKIYNGTKEFDAGCTFVRVGAEIEEPAPAPVAPTVVTDPVVGTGYHLVFAKSDKILYAEGAESDYYGATTETVADADVWTLETADGGFYLTAMNGSNKVYLNAVVSGDFVNPKMQATAATVWVWNATAKNFSCTINETTYYIVSVGTYSSLSISTDLSGASAAYLTAIA